MDTIPGVLEIQRFGGGHPAVVIEVPHGATLRRHFDALHARLRGPFPPGLLDFFSVNTDVGAPEVAEAAARALPSALVIRSLIPRTFIDCNRVLDLDPAAYRAGGVTPGLPPYVRDPRDLELLRGLHRVYQDVAGEAIVQVCDSGGVALLLHTYAPRSVDVDVDDDVGASLRAAWADETRWPLRPEVDLIVRDGDGALRAPERLVRSLKESFSGIGVTAAESTTYALHPATVAHSFAMRFPDNVLCLEIRRDLLTEPWDPFEEMHVSPASAERFGGAIAEALSAG